MPAMRRFSGDASIRRKSPGSGLNRSANAGITSREASVAGQAGGPERDADAADRRGLRHVIQRGLRPGVGGGQAQKQRRREGPQRREDVPVHCRLYEGGAGAGCDGGVTAKQHLFDEQRPRLAVTNRDTIVVTVMALRGAW